MNLVRLTAAKAVANTALRWVPPFLPTLERAFGATTQQLTTVIGLGEMAGLSTIGVGAHLDRGRSRPVMAIALVAISIASLVSLVGTTATFAIGFVLVILGVANLTVAGHAYISHRVPYAQRGRAIGLYETSWAIALLVGAPVIAGLIAVFGWRGPYGVLAVAALLMAVVIWRSPPEPPLPANATPENVTPEDVASGNVTPEHVSPGNAPVEIPVTDGPISVARITTLPLRVWSVMVGSALLAMAGLSVFAISGSWLNDAFGVSTGGLGAVAMGFGAIELVASTGSAGFADRIGKFRSTMAGTATLAVGLVVMTLADDTLWIGVVGIIVFLGGFEFGFVTSLSLVTEAMPSARGTTIALSNAIGTVARGSGTILSGWLFGTHGVEGTITLSAIAATLSATAFVVSRRARS